MKYYKVKSEFFDDGTCTAAIAGTRELKKRPKMSMRSSHISDVYIDWFSSENEARRFIRETRKEGRKGERI